ncbi:DUF4334 domain-containing protein [Cellulosimicrobium sp. Marseille-Q4280]|uniref:DUF4334 domain-containing protein n=1 Tax=Cellulosimicrobium sp. Marseille-Q4280 TaxID=2937992 RepID=UPI0020420916|nr:DUF4334 domain-containing protein [Cellulosimicrobium sp. Marseille-Q4280]
MEAAEQGGSTGTPVPAQRRAALADLERGTTTTAALAFHDSLPAVDVDDVLGTWHGSGIPTGHPLDGLLEALGWYGKRFDGPDAAHPLLFAHRREGVIDVDPAYAPLPLVLRCAGLLRRPPVARAVRTVLPLVRTRRPRARLRRVEHRGVVTTTMVYDALPVHDVLRAVDDDTLLGLMDARGLARPFFFVLRRVGARRQETLPWSSRRQ